MGKKKSDVKSTGASYYHKNCPTCGGSGRVPETNLEGWYIDYHYQDGHEQYGPYTYEKALEEYRSHKDGTSIATLIGPDGKIYK